MVDARLDEKINKLAHEIETLKARLPTDGGWPTSPSRLQRSMSFLIANWVLLSFVVALLTATYAKIAFDIDPFQAYRDAAAKKSLSEFYRKTGDLMMDSGALPEAKRSYDEALKINPYNTEATFGLAKAQVYPGETEVVSAKLDFLSAQRPHDGHVHWLNALRYRLLGNALKYEHEVELCIKERVQAIVCYVELGYIRQGQGNLEDAKANFLKAIKVSPISQLANNNLGFYWLISLEFSSAIKQFE
jgi:tetratricopeptide (TPR) repeat protein